MEKKNPIVQMFNAHPYIFWFVVTDILAILANTLIGIFGKGKAEPKPTE